MELREFTRLLGQFRGRIFFASLIAAAAVFAVSFYWPVSYQASATVYVQKVPEQPASGDYSFDGYYAQQIAEAYTDTVKGFLQSLDILKRATEIAQLPSDTPQLLFYQKRIRAEKVAPQLIKVSIHLRDPSEAQKLVVALAQATQERARVLNQTGEKGMVVDLLTPEPLLEHQHPIVWLNTSAAFLAALILAISGLGLWHYLRDEER